MRIGFALLASLASFVVLVGCGPDPVEQCAALEDASCPSGQVNAEDTVYCEDYYEGECGSEWGDYVECAIESPICTDGDPATKEPYPCDEERTAHGRCLCEVESEHGPSPWCNLYGS